jgi:hypothetical protein
MPQRPCTVKAQRRWPIHCVGHGCDTDYVEQMFGRIDISRLTACDFNPHPTLPESRLWRLMRSIKVGILARLDGYDEAAWELSRRYGAPTTCV